MTSTESKHKLNDDQLQTLMKVTGETEDILQEMYSDLWKRHPNGFLTKEEFMHKFHESELFNGTYKKLYPSQFLFSVMDLNKSGTIDIYELLFALATLQTEDPKVLFDCVFKMFDSDGDGQLTKDELANVLYAYLNMLASRHANEEERKSEHTLDEVKQSIGEAFPGKNFISKQELRDGIEKSEILKSLIMRLHHVFIIGLMFDDSDFQ